MATVMKNVLLYLNQTKVFIMNQTITADVRLLSASHPHITKHTSIFSLVVSSFIALAGVAVILIALDLDQSASTL